jgi:hypothetical protein
MTRCSAIVYRDAGRLTDSESMFFTLAKYLDGVLDVGFIVFSPIRLSSMKMSRPRHYSRSRMFQSLPRHEQSQRRESPNIQSRQMDLPSVPAYGIGSGCTYIGFIERKRSTIKPSFMSTRLGFIPQSTRLVRLHSSSHPPSMISLTS